MRLLAALTGGLLGALPGLLLVVVVGLLTGGMPFFGLAGSLLVAAGAVVGSVLGRRAHDRFADHRLGIAVAGVAALLIVVGLLVVISPGGSLGGFLFLQPIVIGLLVGLPLSAYEPSREKKTGSGTGKRLLTTLVGGLMGLIPILVLLTVARMIGLDESSPVMYFLPGLVLLGGIITGAAVGWRMHHRFADRPAAVAVTGLVTVLMVAGWQVALSGSADETFDPILDARDCREVYEFLGATDRAEILGLPDDLSPTEIQTLEERLAEFEEESPNDPVCDRLHEDLEAQR